MEKIAIELPVKKRLLEIQLFKCYKKLRQKGEYCLVQLPNEFVNGHFNAKTRYGLSLGVDEETQHRVIIIDLDDNRQAINNRR